MASDVRVSLASSFIRFIITCHQSPHLCLPVSSLCSPFSFCMGLFFFPQTLRRVVCNVLGGVRLLAASSSSSLGTKVLLCFSPEPQFNFTASVAIAHSCTHTQSFSHTLFVVVVALLHMDSRTRADMHACELRRSCQD